jgi:hypothetical protein
MTALKHECFSPIICCYIPGSLVIIFQAKCYTVKHAPMLVTSYHMPEDILGPIESCITISAILIHQASYTISPLETVLEANNTTCSVSNNIPNTTLPEIPLICEEKAHAHSNKHASKAYLHSLAARVQFARLQFARLQFARLQLIGLRIFGSWALPVDERCLRLQPRARGHRA